MKRTIISWIIGVIFGIIGCIAAIATVFKKLCNSMLIREEIISSIKNVITIILFGSKRVTYANSYTGRPNKYSASYYYIKEAVRRVEEVKFDSHESAMKAYTDIKEFIEQNGSITVEELLDLLHGGINHTEKYLDKLFGWDSFASFMIGTTGLYYINTLHYICITKDPHKLDNEERRKDDMYVQASATEVQRQ